MRGVVPRSRSKSSQTSGASRRPRQSCAGVTRNAAKWAAHGRFVPLRHVTRRHARAGSAAAMARTASGRRVVGELQARGRTAASGASRGGTATGGVPRKTVSVDEMPRAYGSCRRCSVAAQRRVVAEFGIAEHRGDLEARRADLPQQA